MSGTTQGVRMMFLASESERVMTLQGVGVEELQLGGVVAESSVLQREWESCIL